MKKIVGILIFLTLLGSLITMASIVSSNEGGLTSTIGVFTPGPIHGEGDNAFTGGSILSNGTVVMAPWDSSNVGLYIPSTETYFQGPSRIDLNAGAFIDAVTLQNDTVILIPNNSPHIGIYEPITNTFIQGPDTPGGFYTGILLDNGTVILLPRTGDNFGFYDPVEGTFTLGLAHGVTGNWGGGALLQDGRIILCPATTDFFGVYDTNEDTFSTIAHGKNSDFSLYHGASAIGNRAICTPFRAAAEPVYFEGDTNQLVFGSQHGQGGNAFRGDPIILSNSPYYILPPSSADNIALPRYDLVNPDFILGPSHGMGSDAFWGGIELNNGDVLLIPRGSDRIGIYSPPSDKFGSGAYTDIPHELSIIEDSDIELLHRARIAVNRGEEGNFLITYGILKSNGQREVRSIFTNDGGISWTTPSTVDFTTTNIDARAEPNSISWVKDNTWILCYYIARPNDPGTHAFARVAKSTNNGETWEILLDQQTEHSNMGRTCDIGVSRSNPDHLVMAWSQGNLGRDRCGPLDTFFSKDTGSTWSVFEYNQDQSHDQGSRSISVNVISLEPTPLLSITKAGPACSGSNGFAVDSWCNESEGDICEEGEWGVRVTTDSWENLLHSNAALNNDGSGGFSFFSNRGSESIFSRQWEGDQWEIGSGNEIFDVEGFSPGWITFNYQGSNTWGGLFESSDGRLYGFGTQDGENWGASIINGVTITTPTNAEGFHDLAWEPLTGDLIGVLSENSENLYLLRLGEGLGLPEFIRPVIINSPDSVSNIQSFTVLVQLLDQDDNPVPNRQVALISDPPVIGVIQMTDSSGIATFSGLNIAQTGTYQLIAVDQDGATDTTQIVVTPPTLPPGTTPDIGEGSNFEKVAIASGFNIGALQFLTWIILFFGIAALAFSMTRNPLLSIMISLPLSIGIGVIWGIMQIWVMQIMIFTFGAIWVFLGPRAGESINTPVKIMITWMIYFIFTGLIVANDTSLIPDIPIIEPTRERGFFGTIADSVIVIINIVWVGLSFAFQILTFGIGNVPTFIRLLLIAITNPPLLWAAIRMIRGN
jgi:hypothetical protein